MLVLEHPSVPRRTCPWTRGRDVWWADVIPDQAPDCPVAWVDAEHPLFLLYTSGSTGKPKGVMHCTGAALSFLFLRGAEDYGSLLLRQQISHAPASSAGAACS